MNNTKVLYIIVSAAGPARDVWKFVDMATEREWAVQAISTPNALGFIDSEDLEARTGRPVRSGHRAHGSPRSPKADAIVVAPASFNTINKLAHGISDTYALDVANEAIGLDIPTVILPFINSAYASRAPFRGSVESLRKEGVDVLLGSGAFEPHDAGSGAAVHAQFPWAQALDRLD